MVTVLRCGFNELEANTTSEVMCVAMTFFLQAPGFDRPENSFYRHEETIGKKNEKERREKKNYVNNLKIRKITNNS